MRRRRAFGIAAIAAIVGLPGLIAPRPVEAVGNIIVVTTTSDAEFPGDGKCSLRAAILASNVGGIAGNCSAGSAGQDSIRFDIGSGTPNIIVLTDLPNLTQPVTLRGNTGGATRVVLFGPGAGTGLHVSGMASVIRGMSVQNFDVGIYSDADNVTIAGNRVNENKNIGIYTVNPGVVIGGTTGVTPGGPCTGDCNLVQNNPTGINSQSGGTIQGNFVGTDAAGTAAAPNDFGIKVRYGTWAVGGTATGAGNLISGNTMNGLDVTDCDACTVQGNRIGTDVSGAVALPNVHNAISIVNGDGSTIGGTVAGAGNILSGNGGHGIFAATVDHLTIQGNRIGVGATGGALGNGGDGIGTGASASSVSHLTIGSATNPIAANIIANNAYGIRIVAPILGLGPVQNAIRGNSIYDNVNEGIWIADTTNEVARPLIGSLGPVHGTACALCFVDVFSDHADEGRVFEGTVQADNIGVWTFSGLFAGPLVTATATGASGNTSEFSDAFAIQPTPFTDIGSSLFKKDIEWLYANGITKGCAATLYCPLESVTRDQMASFIAREFHLPSTATDYFTDDETSSHEADINRLAASGITAGCTPTTFCPTAAVSRDQMASFLARATEITAGAGRDYFNDDNGNTHEANIDRTAAAGISTGCGSYKYCPTASVTRGQMAAFLRRVVTPVPPPPFPAP
jgi:CSLREA domain-containing protein